MNRVATSGQIDGMADGESRGLAGVEQRLLSTELERLAGGLVAHSSEHPTGRGNGELRPPVTRSGAAEPEGTDGEPGPHVVSIDEREVLLDGAEESEGPAKTPHPVYEDNVVGLGEQCRQVCVCHPYQRLATIEARAEQSRAAVGRVDAGTPVTMETRGVDDGGDLGAQGGQDARRRGAGNAITDLEDPEACQEVDVHGADASGTCEGS